MSIGITQLIILIIIGILLFGNLPKILKDLGSGIVALKKEVNKTEGEKEKELSEKSLVDKENLKKEDTKTK